jgi:hypothetical protein
MMVTRPGLRWSVSSPGRFSPQRFLIVVVLFYLVAVMRGSLTWLIVALRLLIAYATIVPALATTLWAATRSRAGETAA